MPQLKILKMPNTNSNYTNLSYLPAHIANFFLWNADKEGIKDMTPMKLIKLVYISYAWSLAIYQNKLFNERIEAWRYGPVIPSIYHEFKRWGDSPIKQFSVNSELQTGGISYPVIRKDDFETYRIVETVWKIYKNKSGIDLSSITHEKGSPWNFAYDQGENNPMNDDKIEARAREAILKYKDQILKR